MSAAALVGPWPGAAAPEPATACFTGRVVKAEAFRADDGVIMTRVWVRHSDFGRAADVEMLQAGGSVGRERSAYGGYEPLGAGDVGVFTAGDDGGVLRLRAFHRIAGAPGLLTVAPAGNLLAGSNGVPGRFTASDRGEGIPYYVDASVLPAGVSTAQALTALSHALSAWRTNSSLIFTDMGLETFGRGADAVTSHPGAICIQLGDPYNRVGAYMVDVMGVGGRVEGYTDDYASGGEGGRIGAREFYRTVRGYVIVSHTAAGISNLLTYEEVLGHEVGHALGLAHSSNAPALMWPAAHGDGRGASLGTDDVATIRSIYPTNTPPYGYGRVMRIVVGSPPPAIPGVNELMLWGADLQGAPLSIQLTNMTSDYGSFSTSSNRLGYIYAWWSDTDYEVADPLSGEFYDRVHVRWSDGVNLSPPAEVRVVAYYSDSYSESGNSGSDGLPNAWMNTHFGHLDPRVSDSSRAADDADGDGYPNLTEYLIGSNPRDRASNMRIMMLAPAALRWQARMLDLYALEASASLTGRFTRCANPVAPTGGVGVVSVPTNAARFLRMSRIP